MKTSLPKSEKKIELVYIISQINKSLALEWTLFRLSKEKDLHLSVVLLNPGTSALEHFLFTHDIDNYRLRFRSKWDYPSVCLQLWSLLRKLKADIVHTHLFDASLLGLFTARWAGVKRRILTRHHATFHHEYFPRAVWYDRLINSMATKIVAISKNVQSVLTHQEGVAPDKVFIIEHGFEMEYFSEVIPAKVEKLREIYAIDQQGPIIGVISRYFELKGIHFIIPAFKAILQDYPDACLLMANTKGNYTSVIANLLSELPERSYREITFESHLAELYQCMDVFIHVPINPQTEAFGQTYVEALAAGIPSVFTLSGIAPEFIEHEVNALVVPFQDSNAIEKAIRRLLSTSELREQLSRKGRETVEHRFAMPEMMRKLKQLYLG
jgi:glycosyltransferase involved in cell wall biosynthesis